MELVVLGTGAAYPGPGQACSGYLVKEGDTGLLLDCGNGTVARLQEAAELEKVTAVLFSHLHADHLLDIFNIFYSQVYGVRKACPPLPMYLPPGEADRFARLAEVLRVEPRRLFEGVFQVSEYDPRAGLSVDNLHVTFARNQHPIPTNAVRVESGPASMAYSSDTGPYPELAAFVAECDLLLSEASLSDADFDPAHPIHLTPRLAAELARDAGVGRLLLTHIWPYYDRKAMLEQARAIFAPTELAEELRRYPVP